MSQNHSHDAPIILRDLSWGGGGVQQFSTHTALQPEFKPLLILKQAGLGGGGGQNMPLVVGAPFPTLSPPPPAQPTSLPSQWAGTQPTHPRVDNALLKRCTCAYSQKYQPAYSFSLSGTPRPPSQPPPHEFLPQERTAPPLRHPSA